ncbi:MAG: extracellular solute-binding protein [Acidimicrobiales bacterium]
MTTRQMIVPAVASALILAATAAGCGSSAHSGLGKGHGRVNVLYAASLLDLMQKNVEPAFQAATGYTVEGFPAGSKALVAEIKGEVRRGDVFISASPTVNKDLEGASNGGWVSWYVTFATAPLVIGYNPSSRFAHDLRTKPWYEVVTEPGFLLGRTDPSTDPKGKLAVTALESAATAHDIPALAALAHTTEGMFPEETLVGRLQAGQLDAGFFYSSEAAAAKIPTVALTGEDLKASYTITVLRGAPDPAGAEAFVTWLLGGAGQAGLTSEGFHLLSPPTVTGTGVPAGVRRA